MPHENMFHSPAGPSGASSATRRRRRMISSDTEDTSPSRLSDDSSSDSNDSSSSEHRSRPSCCICLNKLSRHEVASPELCDHLYCIICLQSWAQGRAEATCPIDRQPFTVIKVRKIDDSTVIRTIPVFLKEIPLPGDENLEAAALIEIDDEFNTYCEVCRECDREEAMLLCDSCDSGYHMDCLEPALEVVPIEEWFCPSCSLIVDVTRAMASVSQAEPTRQQRNRPQTTNVSRERQDGGGGSNEYVHVLPRTREVERVRKRVHKIRENKAKKKKRGRKKKKRNEGDNNENQSNASIIPLLYAFGDECGDFDAMTTFDPIAESLLKRSGNAETKTRDVASVVRGGMSVPLPTYCGGRSEIEKRVETCSSSAVNLLDDLLDSQSTLLTKQVDITEERKLVARGKKRELADSDDESLLCMRRPLPSVRMEMEKQERKISEEKRELDKACLKTEKINEDEGCSHSGTRKPADVSYVSVERQSKRSDEKRRDYWPWNRSSYSPSDSSGFRKRDHYKYRETKERNSYDNPSICWGYHAYNIRDRAREDSRKYGNSREVSRCAHRSDDRYERYSRDRHQRDSGRSLASERSHREKRHSKVWGFGRRNGSSANTIPSHSPCKVMKQNAGPVDSDISSYLNNREKTTNYSQHTMILPKALMSSVASKNKEFPDSLCISSSIVGPVTEKNASMNLGRNETNATTSDDLASMKEWALYNDSKAFQTKNSVSTTTGKSEDSDPYKETPANEANKFLDVPLNVNTRKSEDIASRMTFLFGDNDDNVDTAESYKCTSQSTNRGFRKTNNINLIKSSIDKVRQAEAKSLGSEREANCEDNLRILVPSSCNGENFAISESLTIHEEFNPTKSNGMTESSDATCASIAVESPSMIQTSTRMCASSVISLSDTARLSGSSLADEAPAAEGMPIFNCVRKKEEASVPNLRSDHQGENNDGSIFAANVNAAESSSSNGILSSSPLVVILDKASVASVVKKRLDRPFHAKEINKQSYKEIVFKCVHKIIEKDSGTHAAVEKINKLVDNYLQFYQHKENKIKRRSTDGAQ
ncbi:uncharacterized protein LOC108674966 [Hyalella azteca]|uniref:Uncharacterized protein LOC108674966 n=1 Tax=Hyalella azteca TaxID=294128 RepID=A0A8B7NXF3_HYAAZ|nr:uncharacterized protein LOC108674966 [Hyalella azteca]